MRSNRKANGGMCIAGWLVMVLDEPNNPYVADWEVVPAVVKADETLSVSLIVAPVAKEKIQTASSGPPTTVEITMERIPAPLLTMGFVVVWPVAEVVTNE